MRHFLLLIGLAAAALPCQSAQPLRERRNFDDGWLFHKGDVSGGERANFNDARWQKVRLPHDWSIEGPYAATNPSGNGFLPGGIGWYRKSFAFPETLAGRQFAIEFDGVYRDSDVWINGHHLGHRPYGYSSFAYDLTPFLNAAGKANVLAVRADHSDAADSRWYTGSGIYRHVWLEITHAVRVGHWGTYVRTPMVSATEALVSLEINAVNGSDAETLVRVATSIQDANDRQVAATAGEQKIPAGAGRVFQLQAAVPNPKLWSLAEPNLYTAVTQVFAGTELRDEYRTRFGIRTVRFDSAHGFFLNGKPEKLKGVCLHHDLGALGAAFSEAALERRLVLLKELGVNAIRCSHNPMAPEEYDLADRLGLLVMDEAFDEWTAGKRKWREGWNAGTPGFGGYHEAFEDWWQRDIEDMVLRDRNHPSIVLWSIGNEIDYPGDPFGHPKGRDGLKLGMLDANTLPAVARGLIAAVKRLDGTRPVTEALADVNASNATGLAGLLDVAGYNYLEQFYARDHATWPERVILGSENSHSLEAWNVVAANEWVAGQFLWTGIDFLGESARYPSRGSSAGLLDICGFRKPDAWLRAALWSEKPMVYAAAEAAAPEGARAGRGRSPLLEHWNWSGDERRTIPVVVYTNCDSAELFLNGRSLGEKQVADRAQPVLRWDVPNQTGALRAVGKRQGLEAARFELATTGAPDRLVLAADRTTIAAGGDGLAHIEVRVVDSQGRWVSSLPSPPEITVEATGAAQVAAVDTGDPRDISPITDHRKAFQGRALAIVRAGDTPGVARVRATAPGLMAGEVALEVK